MSRTIPSSQCETNLWSTQVNIVRLFTNRANQALRSLANAGFQNRGVCLQAFPSFPSPSPHFHFLALVSFLARPKPRILFLGLSLLRNQTETLAAQAIWTTTTTHRLMRVWIGGEGGPLVTLGTRGLFSRATRSTSCPKTRAVKPRRYQTDGALVQRLFARVTFEDLSETGNRGSGTHGIHLSVVG